MKVVVGEVFDAAWVGAVGDCFMDVADYAVVGDYDAVDCGVVCGWDAGFCLRFFLVAEVALDDRGGGVFMR